MSGKSYTYNQCDPKADVVTSEGSASGIQTSVGTAPLVQPATGTSEVDQVVESKELGNVAKAIENFWDEFAVELDPVLFQATGNIQTIKNIKDFATPIMEAHVMLEKWRDAKDKDATRRPLIETLCKMGKVKQANDIFGQSLTDFVWLHMTDVTDGPLPPDKQRDPVTAKPDPGNGKASGKAEATPTVAGFSQAPEFDAALDGPVPRECLISVAQAVADSWEYLAVFLDPELFDGICRNDIKFQYPQDSFMQSVTMLGKWQDHLHGNCRRLISALCEMNRKDIAIREFGERLVEFLLQKPEHSHATPTVKAGPQQPQSAMQVESAPDTTGNAGNKLTLDQLKLVGLGKGVKLMNLSPMKEIVTPDKNNIIRKPSVASNMDIVHDLEVSESEFAKGLEVSFRTGVAQALNFNVSFMKDKHHSSKHLRSIHVGKVLSETVDLSDELPHSSSIPFENSLKKVAEKKYPRGNFNDKQRDEICKEVIEKEYENTTHFISSVDLGVMYSLVTEEKDRTNGKTQNVNVSADIKVFIEAKLGGGVKRRRKELERDLCVKTLKKRIGKLGADGKPKETDGIGCKVRPIWSVIKDEGWKESVKRVCSEILPVPVGEREPIVIKAAGPSPRYLKVSKVDNFAAGAKEQLTSKWRVEETAEKSKASKIYVVDDTETKDGGGGTVISLNTEIDNEKIFLIPEKGGILAAKSFQSSTESKFVLVKPKNYDKGCDISEWQREEPLCIRRLRTKRRICPLGKSIKFVALPNKEGSNATPEMKRADDISNGGWTGQFLIEPVM